MDEPALVKKAASGDAEAFKRLVLLNKKSISGIVKAIVVNQEDADDIIQEVFCKAYRGIKNFRGESKFSTWLFRIAKNASIDLLRQKEREFFNRSTYQDAQVHANKNISSENLQLTEDEAFVRTAVDKLDAESKEILLYVFFAGLKQQDVAEMLDIPLGTVHSRVHTAKEKLKKVIQNEDFQE